MQLRKEHEDQYKPKIIIDVNLENLKQREKEKEREKLKEMERETERVAREREKELDRQEREQERIRDGSEHPSSDHERRRGSDHSDSKSHSEDGHHHHHRHKHHHHHHHHHRQGSIAAGPASPALSSPGDDHYDDGPPEMDIDDEPFNPPASNGSNGKTQCNNRGLGIIFHLLPVFTSVTAAHSDWTSPAKMEFKKKEKKKMGVKEAFNTDDDEDSSLGSGKKRKLIPLGMSLAL